MTKVLDESLLVRAAREAERALAAGDPDTLAGRFSPNPVPAQIAEPPPRQAAQGKATMR